MHYLKSNGVHFQYNTQVLDIQFDIQPDRKMAKQIIVKHNGNIETVDLVADDLVRNNFV